MDDLSQPVLPQSEQDSSSRMKTVVVTLVAALMVFGAAFGVYWFVNSRSSSSVAALPSDPRDLFIEGIHKIVQAKSFHMSAQSSLRSLSEQSPALAGGAETLHEFGVDPKDLMLSFDANIQHATATSTDVDLMFGLTDSSKKTDLGLNMRLVGGESYLELARATLPKSPINLNPIIGTWVHLNVKELTSQFAGAAGGEANKEYQQRTAAQEAIQYDREKYFQIFADAYRKDVPLAMTYGEQNNEHVTVKSAIKDTAAFRSSMQKTIDDAAPALIQQILADVDAAIAREQQAGHADVVEALQKSRTEAVDQFGADGSKFKEMFDEIYSQELESMASSTPHQYEGELVFDRTTGRLIHTSSWVLNADGTRRTEPDSTITIDKYNEDLHITKPQNAKSLQDMFPVFMGIMFGAMATDVPTSTEESDNSQKFTAVDTDRDGLTDDEEIFRYSTDPNRADTDGDGYSDGDEVKNGFNPNGSGALKK